jgi:hypothetical protein
MFNFLREFNNTTNSDIDNPDYKITKFLRVLTIMTIILSLSRLISFEILTMIGEIMTAIMIYLYSLSRSICMAIFCMVNGVIGLVFSLMRIFHTFPTMKSNWFSIYYSLLFLIAFYSLIVYLLICYFSYLGIKQNVQNVDGLLPTATNYGAISIENINTKSFKPFQGKGMILG